MSARPAVFCPPLALAALMFSVGAMAQPPAAPPRVEHFKIEVAAGEVLDDLAERASTARAVSRCSAGTGWTYGADTAYLRELADYWQREFDWRAQESALNGFENYRANDRRHAHPASCTPRAADYQYDSDYSCCTAGPALVRADARHHPYLTDPARTACRTRRASTSPQKLPGFGLSDIPTRPWRQLCDQRRVRVEARCTRAGPPTLWGARRSRRRDRAAGDAANPDRSSACTDGHHRRGGDSAADPAEGSPWTRAPRSSRSRTRLPISKPQTLAHSLNIRRRPGSVDRREIPHLVRFQR